MEDEAELSGRFGIADCTPVQIETVHCTPVQIEIGDVTGIVEI